MIHIPTAIWAHYAFDALAWASGALAALWQHRRWPSDTVPLSRSAEPSYFISLAVGAVIGAWLFGSLNALRSSFVAPAHSIAGALAGGILAVEIWKWRRGVRRSTGGSFVLPICVGIIVGRLGCFFAGLPDFTYGNPTSMPWAVDFGDGIGRHPVQLYESVATVVFTLIYLRARERHADWAINDAFYALIIFYSVQRSLWEFLKPYPTVVGPLNVFHLLMFGLIIYGVLWWRRDREVRLRSSAAGASAARV